MKKRIRSTIQIARPCTNLRVAHAQPDGSIRLCGCRIAKTDQDDLIVGRVGDNIETLNTNATTIRNRFATKDYPMACKNCSFYTPE